MRRAALCGEAIGTWHMRAWSSALTVHGFGSAEQTCQALEPVTLHAGHGAGQYDEGWLQNLIQSHPALLPVADIEPGLLPLIPICTELPVPSGYVDNLMLTPEGGIIVVETKLWRNPQARREVVGQVLDYAKDLSAFSYDDLEIAAGAALKRRGVKLIDLVSAAAPGLDEARFIDAVTRNLVLGRFLLIIAGDGIHEGAEQLVAFVQRHVGLHFTLGLVEMSLWHIPEDDRIIVLPRIIARTVLLERAVVRAEPGVVITPADVRPASSGAIRAPTLSEAQFYEGLAMVSPELPARLRTFVAQLADLGVFAEVRRNLSLKWRGPDGQDYHLGSVNLNGTVGSDYCNWSADAIGRIDLSHAYLADLAALLTGGAVRETAKPTGWRVVVGAGDPPLTALLDQHNAWAAAIDKFTAAVRNAVQS